jgi:septal ring-binding cell division protein DamX
MMNIKRHGTCLLAVLTTVLAAAFSVGCTNSSMEMLAKKTEREAGIWDCRSNSLGGWECSAPNARVSLPSRQASTPALPPPPQTETTSAAIQTEAATAPAVREETAKHPLLEFPSHYYAVQLLAAKNESTITRYQNKYPAIRAETVSVNYNGNHFQLLILGVYPSASEARQAIAQLPTTPHPDPWIRPLAPLQTILQTSQTHDL